jgi:hypothetical protein
MKIHIAHHIFASVKGYQTQFCSADIADSENAELEIFSFGQTNDTDYIASLANHPAFLVRRLESGRWAITRVFQGQKDEYNRATLLFHTILLYPADWLHRLGCDIKPILDHPTVWQEKNLDAISVEPDNSSLPSNIQGQVHALIAKVTTSNSPVIVDESACSFEVARWIHRLLLDEEKESYSYGYRVLSDRMDVSLLCLAHQALRTTTGGRSREKSFASEINNVIAPEIADISEDKIIGTEPTGPNRIVLLGILFVCIIGISAALLALVLYRQDQSTKYIYRVKSFLENEKFIKDSADRSKKIDEAKKLKSGQPHRFVKSDPDFEEIMDRLDNWIKDATDIGELYDKIENAKKEFNNTSSDLQHYPEPDITKKIVLFRNIILENQSNEYFDPQTLIEIKEFRVQIEKLSDSLRVKYLDAIEKRTYEIEDSLHRCDPNLFEVEDPNKVDFSDPNMPKWVDPSQFLQIAEKHIQSINQLKRDIENLRGEISFENAKQSSIQSHLALAKNLETNLNSLYKMTTQFNNTMIIMRSRAANIRNIEDRFNRSQMGDPIKTFRDELIQYEIEVKNATEPIYRVWANHYKTILLKYYAENAKTHFHNILWDTNSNERNKVIDLRVPLKINEIACNGLQL